MYSLYYSCFVCLFESYFNPPFYVCSSVIGTYCEHMMSHCVNNPCHNRATCHDVTGTYQCVCPPGVTGNTSETGMIFIWDRKLDNNHNASLNILLQVSYARRT